MADHKNGFSLVELLVVFAILGILAAVGGVYTYNDYKIKKTVIELHRLSRSYANEFEIAANLSTSPSDFENRANRVLFSFTGGTGNVNLPASQLPPGISRCNFQVRSIPSSLAFVTCYGYNTGPRPNAANGQDLGGGIYVMCVYNSTTKKCISTCGALITYPSYIYDKYLPHACRANRI